MEKKPDIFKNVDEKDLLREEYKPNRFRKLIIAIIGFMMVFLILSISLPLERIGSIIESKNINDDYTIDLEKGKKVIFTKEIYENLKKRYVLEENEFKVCLLGQKQKNNYIIKDYYVPKIISSTFVSVTSVSCNSSTIISMHSHPSMFCIFSRQDIKSYEKLKLTNPEIFIGLICNTDRFNFYGYE